MRVTQSDIDSLRDEMQAACIEFGEVTLASGEKSNYYYDGKRRALHPRWALLMAHALSDLVIDSGAEAVGGMAVGAVPIAQTVSVVAFQEKHLEIPVFFVRPDKKTHGTEEKLSAAYRNDGKSVLQPGTRVAMVDDVVTTGGSVQDAIDLVEQLGCQVVLVAAVVERHEGGGRRLAAAGYNFKRLFYTDSSGKLWIDESTASRYSETPPARVSPR